MSKTFFEYETPELTTFQWRVAVGNEEDDDWVGPPPDSDLPDPGGF